MTNLTRGCPHCGRVNEAAAGLSTTAAPAPGDVSICWACGGIGIFTEDAVRLPTTDELAELEAAPEIKQAQAAIRESYTPSEAVALVRGGGTSC